MKWLGKCPSCNEWNTLVEEVLDKGTKEQTWSGVGARKANKVIALQDVAALEEVRIVTKDAELNRVLGGGMVTAMWDTIIAHVMRAGPDRSATNSPVLPRRALVMALVLLWETRIGDALVSLAILEGPAATLAIASVVRQTPTLTLALGGKIPLR